MRTLIQQSELIQTNTDYNINHSNIVSSLNSTTSSLLSISNSNSTSNSLTNTNLKTYLRTSVFNTTNQSTINNLNTLNSMIYSDGDISINCNNNVNFKAVLNSQLRIPLSVRPSHIVVDSTTNPSFVINSSQAGQSGTLRINTPSEASIAFNNPSSSCVMGNSSWAGANNVIT